jgi:hypothetical protein
VELTLLAKDVESGKNGCPSVYLDEEGLLVIQGGTLDVATRTNLINMLPGEDAVRIKPDIVREALANLRV